MADLSCSQAEHWNLMLTVMSTWRTISYVPKLNAVLPADDLVADFIQPLPEWNFSFFYDLIKHNNWIKYFLQVVLTVMYGMEWGELVYFHQCA